MRLRIKELREAQGISYRDLAFKAGVTKEMVRKLEEDVTHEPAPWTLRKLATALGVRVDDLVLRDEGG